jgi:hypothetical protein
MFHQLRGYWHLQKKFHLHLQQERLLLQMGFEPPFKHQRMEQLQTSLLLLFHQISRVLTQRDGVS